MLLIGEKLMEESCEGQVRQDLLTFIKESKERQDGCVVEGTVIWGTEYYGKGSRMYLCHIHLI